MNCEDIIRVKYLNFYEYKMKERVTRVEMGGGGGGEEEEKMEKISSLFNRYAVHTSNWSH